MPPGRGSTGRAAPRVAAGFSLVELIVVIVVTGVMAGTVGMFIAGPIQAYIDQARRAELVDAAQIALVRMGRDLRAALPNSVRVSGSALELLLTLDGDRYRVESPGTADDRLNFAAADSKFNTLAPLAPPAVVPAYGTTWRVNGSLAIYPLLQAGANPYSDEVMTARGDLDFERVQSPAGAGLGPDEYRVTLPAAHRFPVDAPSRRVFLVSGPVTYLCDGGALLRYEGYALQDPQVAVAGGLDALTPANGRTVVVRDVTACAFSFDPGTAQRNAVVSAALVLADAAAPTERVRLVRQVHVGNAP